MMFPRLQSFFAFLIAVSFSLVASSAFAQSNESDGRLKIHVNPKQAYVFVDGKAIRDGSQTIDLQSGSHEVSVRNYGLHPEHARRANQRQKDD